MLPEQIMMNNLLFSEWGRVGGHSTRSAIFGLALLAMLPLAAAQDDDTELPKPAIEEPVKLPSLPKAADLIPIESAPNASMSFAIDAKSLTIGKDEVIRYTVVATSRSGAVNVIHEGLRCKTFEYRQYAFGRKDGGWTPARSDRWQTISSMAHNQSHTILARDYFCDGKVISGRAGDILDRIRYRRSLEYSR